MINYELKPTFDNLKNSILTDSVGRNKSIAHLKQPADTRIVFFIDELDRCCPNFAVRLLERIKHYFLHEKVIFVVSVNMSELQHTIKRHYGNDFNADKYLRRFFDFTIPLPPADMRKYYETINFKDNEAKYVVANSMIEKYNFSLRGSVRWIV